MYIVYLYIEIYNVYLTVITLPPALLKAAILTYAISRETF
jgi:hypothetical protein